MSLLAYLNKAAKDGDSEKFYILLKKINENPHVIDSIMKGMDPFKFWLWSVNESDWTLLHFAAYKGHKALN